MSPLLLVFENFMLGINIFNKKTQEVSILHNWNGKHPLNSTIFVRQKVVRVQFSWHTWPLTFAVSYTY